MQDASNEELRGKSLSNAAYRYLGVSYCFFVRGVWDRGAQGVATDVSVCVVGKRTLFLWPWALLLSLWRKRKTKAILSAPYK